VTTKGGLSSAIQVPFSVLSVTSLSCIFVYLYFYVSLFLWAFSGTFIYLYFIYFRFFLLTTVCTVCTLSTINKDDDDDEDDFGSQFFSEVV